MGFFLVIYCLFFGLSTTVKKNQLRELKQMPMPLAMSHCLFDRDKGKNVSSVQGIFTLVQNNYQVITAINVSSAYVED